MNELDAHFRFLYSQLSEIYAGYSKYVFTTTASILLVLGWLLTSKDARTYIGDHQWIKAPFTVAVAFFLFAEIWLSRRALQTSKQMADPIRSTLATTSDQHISASYYTSKVVPLKGAIMFSTAHALLYIVLVLVIVHWTADKLYEVIRRLV